MLLKRMFLSILSLGLGLALAYSGGSGTAADPYKVANINDLNEVRNNLGAYFIQTADMDFDTSVYRKGGTSTWVPIGGSNTLPFKGNYNGNDFRIKNFYMKTARSAALFGSVSETATTGAKATLKNIALENVDVTGEALVAALVVQANGGSTIEGCYATGKVQAMGSQAGGLIAYFSNITVSKCYFNGSVSAPNHVGGLLGYSDCSGATITNSYSVGTVNGTWNVGGLIGLSGSSTYKLTITNCYAVTKFLSGIGNGIYLPTASTVSNTYYSSERSGKSDLSGAAKTNAQLMQQATFFGFDFTNTWIISEGSSFPRLRGMVNAPVLLNEPSSTLMKLQTVFSFTPQIVLMDYVNPVYALSGKPGTMQLDVSTASMSWATNVLGRQSLTLSVQNNSGAQGSNKHILPSWELGVWDVLGEGTLASPYQLTSPQELDLMRYQPTSYFELMQDLNLAVVPYNTGEGWEPIGNSTTPFKGVFNGNGHAISGLSIKKPSGLYLGLFGAVLNAKIQNLRLIDVAISGRSYVGTLLGNGENTTIHNVHVTGSVTGDEHTGGVLGFGQNANVDSSSFEGTVKGNSRSGGFAGFFYMSNVQDCQTKASVNVNSMNGDVPLGGFVGESNQSTFLRCISKGTLQGSSNAGGFVGKESYATSTSMGSFKQCIAQVKVSGYNYVGGFIGQQGATKIEESYAVGTVTATGTPSGGFTGGLNGTYGTVTKSYYDSDVSGKTDATYATPKTTDEMHALATFANWDFTNTWEIAEAQSYPRFKGANVLPVLDALGSLNEDGSLTLSATDANGDAVTLNIAPGEHYTANSATITPAAEFNGTLQVTVNLNDGYANKDTLVSIPVLPVQDAPVWGMVPTLVMQEDASLELLATDIAATDVDGDALSVTPTAGEHYTVSGASVIPDANYFGMLSVPVEVSDGIATISKTLNIEVKSVNDAPVIQSIRDTSIAMNGSLKPSLKILSAEDVEGDDLSIVLKAGKNYTLSNGSVVPTKDFVGDITVGIAVSDGELESEVKTFTLKVTKPVSVLASVNHALQIRVKQTPQNVQFFVCSASGYIESARIWNTKGKDVAALHSGNENHLVWNYSGSQGAKVPAGLYIVKLIGYSATGAKEESQVLLQIP